MRHSLRSSFRSYRLVFFLLANLTLCARSAYTQVEIEHLSFQPERHLSLTDLQTLLNSTERYRAQTKLKTVDPLELANDHWHPGSWGRGYYSTHYGQLNFSNFLDGFATSDSGMKYWGCHPLVRYTGRMLRAHIHARILYPELENQAIINHAIHFLLDEQLPEGQFPYYKYRLSKSEPNPLISNSEGEEEYETSEALRAMTDAYFYIHNNASLYSDSAKDSLHKAITRAALWLATRHDNWTKWRFNSNIPGFVLWALTGAQRIETNAECERAIDNLCKLLVARQQKSGDWTGMWLTGSTDLVEQGQSIKHDTKIWYHALILRGLVEAFDVLPRSPLKAEVTTAIKLGVNHIIRDRLREQYPSIKSYPTEDSPFSIGGEAFFEMLSLLAYNANFHTEFTIAERKSLFNLLNKIAINIDTSIETFDLLQNYNAAAYYSSYSNAIRIQDLINNTNRNSSNITGAPLSVLSGDFDGDGIDNNFLALLRRADGQTLFHVWTHDRNTRQLPDLKTFLVAQHNYPEDKTMSIAGDFNRDGNQNDLLVLFQDSNDQYKMHRWTFGNNAPSLKTVFTGTDPLSVKFLRTSLLHGDFDNDGHADDIAAFSTDMHKMNFYFWVFDESTDSFSLIKPPGYSELK